MANTKNKKINETVNNSIIEVVINGMTAFDAAEEVVTRLDSVEKSVFNIALLTAYGTGVTIPEYIDNKGVKHGQATCEKPLKQADFVEEVGRTSKAISRWCTAMNLIIENNYFDIFAQGLLPFSYDKIIALLKEENKPAFAKTEADRKKSLEDWFNMSAKGLEAKVSNYKKKADDDKKPDEKKAEEKTTENTATSQEENTQEVEKTTEEHATILYNGEEYTLCMDKPTFEKWLKENVIVK